uniref:G-protein coupled receptors family 1 profile domain-containing protein n=1 Tax=Romanomermis culicivorax TaxID=13658 RepID=A0A915JYF5_ROMCU
MTDTTPLASKILQPINLFTSLLSIIGNSLLVYLFITKNSGVKISAFQKAQIIGEFSFGWAFLIETCNYLRIQFLNGWYSTFFCLSISLPKYSSAYFSMFLTLTLSFERYCSFVRPLKTKKLMKNSRFVQLAILIELILSISYASLGYVGVDYRDKPCSCTPSYIRIKILKPMFSYFILVVGTLICIIYMLILFQIGRKRRKSKIWSQRIKLDKDLKASKVVLSTIVASLLFHSLPNFVLLLLCTFGILESKDLGSYVSCFSSVFCAFNFPIYLWNDQHLLTYLRGRVRPAAEKTAEPSAIGKDMIETTARSTSKVFTTSQSEKKTKLSKAKKLIMLVQE